MNAPATLPRSRPLVEQGEPSYVLHTYPFKETSLVVEVFSCGFGRIALVAKGARRRNSLLRGVLSAFQPLLLSWSGKSDLKVLHRAEWQGGKHQLAGLALICGFYLNELMLRLMGRDDPHEGLYADYESALDALREGQTPAAVLRRFERHMLTELGYGLALTQDVHGRAIEPREEYLYLLERGPVPVREQPAVGDAPTLTGRALLDIQRDDYSDSATLLQARGLMRHVINHYLGGRRLHTRQLLREMQQP